jgi:RNA polymerase sigma factor for flagellar operon FliA
VIPLDPEALARLPALASGTACPLEGIARRREQGALARAVARLPEREARITRMHYFDEVPLREIAAHLMVTPARVSQLHSRALKTLRALLVADAAVA